MTIQTGIPLPDPYRYANQAVIAPNVRSLDVGQSFALPISKRKSLRYALWYVRTHPDHSHKQFSTRTVEEEGVMMVRCWRMK